MVQDRSRPDLSTNPDMRAGYNQRRLDAEWLTLSAIREMLGIGLKGPGVPTYRESLAVGRVLAPGIFDSDTTLLYDNAEPQLVRQYRQQALAQSEKGNRTIAPIDLVDEDIDKFASLLGTKQETDQLEQRIRILQSTRRQLQEKGYTETNLIIRDVQKAERDLPNPPVEYDSYREYRVTASRGLRLRLLHPDPPEHSIGADLVYEHYWEDRRLARLAVIQYKIWDGERLYFSQSEGLEEQIQKMRKAFCQSDLCQQPHTSRPTSEYRLPCCAAFLRPTRKLQSPDSRLISRGLHLPICMIGQSVRFTSQNNKVLESRRFRSEALSHKVFEELFNIGMVGTGWLTYDDVERLYREHSIITPDETIVLHAQEFTV